MRSTHTGAVPERKRGCGGSLLEPPRLRPLRSRILPPTWATWEGSELGYTFASKETRYREQTP